MFPADLLFLWDGDVEELKLYTQENKRNAHKERVVFFYGAYKN